jgi:translation elongation factor EF-Tu-like GTPase
MTAMTLVAPDPDLRRRIRPSREQLRVAAAMFAVACEDVTSVVVPVVVTGSVDVGPADADPRLEYPGGYWLADRSASTGAYGYGPARDAAEAAAAAHLRARGVRGVPAWVSIRTDGTWAPLS